MAPTRAGRASAERAAGVALAWIATYTGVRLFWQLDRPPGPMSPVGADLVVFTGWGAIGLCTAAGLAAAGMRVAARPKTVRTTGGTRRPLLAAAWTASGALVVAGAPLLLLDVVGGALPGLGIPFYPLGALSKAACVTAGILLGLAARAYARATREGCQGCGRSEPTPAAARGDEPPSWAYWAAYASVVGCLARIAAQAWVGFGASPFGGGMSVLVFEAGFVLGGTLLPLALVHGWGRTWPRWLPRIGGRRVPRRLVLGPAVFVSGGLVTYFGVTLAQMIIERLHGRNPFPASGGLDLPETFFWFAVPAYVVWGAGIAVAAVSFARRTRPACRLCGS